MAETEVDTYGRVLIPKGVREKLGLKSGTSLQMTVKGSELILRIRDVKLEKRVDELAEYLEREAPKPFVSEILREDSKWFSRRHCLRKLGL